MMHTIAFILSVCLLSCAFGKKLISVLILNSLKLVFTALPTPLVQDLVFVQNEIKSDGFGRVVGGAAASSGQFPYMVSVRRSDFHICGATIVSNVYLISAAHCTVG